MLFDEYEITAFISLKRSSIFLLENVIHLFIFFFFGGGGGREGGGGFHFCVRFFAVLTQTKLSLVILQCFGIGAGADDRIRLSLF